MYMLWRKSTFTTSELFPEAQLEATILHGAMRSLGYRDSSAQFSLVKGKIGLGSYFLHGLFGMGKWARLGFCF